MQRIHGDARERVKPTSVCRTLLKAPHMPILPCGWRAYLLKRDIRSLAGRGAGRHRRQQPSCSEEVKRLLGCSVFCSLLGPRHRCERRLLIPAVGGVQSRNAKVACEFRAGRRRWSILYDKDRGSSIHLCMGCFSGQGILLVSVRNPAASWAVSGIRARSPYTIRRNCNEIENCVT